MADQELNAIISQRIDLSPDLTIMRITPSGWDIPDFKAGQYCAIGLPGSTPRCEGSKPDKEAVDADKVIKRAYSIASPPKAKDHLELYITLVKDGALTPRLFSLKLGDKLWVSPKVVGMFTMDDVPEDANVVFIGTGTGIAPYMSMLRNNLFNETKRNVAVLHGVRSSWDLGYRSELEMLQHTNKHFTYLPSITRPQNEPVPWNGHTGRIQEIWKEGVLEKRWGVKPTPENTHIFLCGNPGMIQEAMEIFDSEGFVEHTRRTPGQIHVEKYW